VSQTVAPREFTHPAVPASRIICAQFLPLILGICFNTIWQMLIFWDFSLGYLSTCA